MQKMCQMGKKRWEAMDVISLILMTLITLCIFIPFYNSIVISFSTSGSYLRNPFAFWPSEGTLANYTKVLKNGTIYNCYLNTILITVVGTVLSMSTSVAAAFAFSRKAFPGKRFVFMLMLFTMFFSGGLVPLYMTVSSLHLISTKTILIIFIAVNTYNLIIARTFIQNSIPEDLYEAAVLDGCSHFTYFIKVVLPLSKAVNSVLILYYAVYHWNDYFNALIFNSKSENAPLQIVLRKYAVIIVSTVPILCVYPFIQKYFEKGVMIGAVKG